MPWRPRCPSPWGRTRADEFPAANERIQSTAHVERGLRPSDLPRGEELPAGHCQSIWVNAACTRRPCSPSLCHAHEYIEKGAGGMHPILRNLAVARRCVCGGDGKSLCVKKLGVTRIWFCTELWRSSAPPESGTSEAVVQGGFIALRPPAGTRTRRSLAGPDVLQGRATPLLCWRPKAENSRREASESVCVSAGCRLSFGPASRCP